MQISVVIPTYNRAHCLPRALASVLAQTFAVAEIIVVDDGSTDNTAELLLGYDTIVTISQANRGVSAARNVGIAAAKSEWIAFLDSDDEWMPKKIACQVAALETDTATEICHSDEIWIRNGRRVNAMKKHDKRGGDIFEYSLPMCRVSPSSVLIKRVLLDQVGGFDERLPACEDYDLWLRLFIEHPVTFVAEPLLVKYGGHDDQLSRQYWGMDRFRCQSLAKLLDDPRLTAKQRDAVLIVLREKLSILYNGAVKREKTQEANGYAQQLNAIKQA